MLSIGKIALGQHRYYERQVAQGWDDYYAGRGEAPGEWVGSGAAALGLPGRVSGRAFSALLAGCDPRDPAVRLRSSARDPRVAALDLTFSAPKSVSVLAAVGDEELARELILAHEEAVRAALRYLEDVAVQVRRGYNGGRVERAEGLVAAAYRHRMSRALDPQLHTHVVAANLACGPDGRFTALHGAPLYRAAKTAGYLYQSHLRALLSHRLGLVWGPVRAGAAELEGVPEPVLVEFSKRRRQMQRAAAQGGIGLGSKASAEAAALASRERKRYGIDTHTWREEVRARAGELGLDARELTGLLGRGRKRVGRGGRQRGEVDERAFGEVLAGPQGLTARANTFDERAVLQEFAGAARQGALVEEVRGWAARFSERPDVIETSAGEMTTAELVDCERRLIAAAVDRTQEGVGVVAGVLVERAIAAAERPLSREQAMAVRAAVGSGDGVSVIQALAGTGKTYTAGVLREVYESAGYGVLGVAPTGRAVRELAEAAGVRARTLERLLLDLKEPGEELPERCVLIVDEAGMAPTRASARMLEAAARACVKVVVIGDEGQLSSVGAGGWLGAVSRQRGAIRLTEVMRQRDPGERRALAALHEQLPGRYLEWASQAGRIDTFADAAGACEHAVSEWQRAATTVGPAQAVMIARDNDTRAVLNGAARERWRTLGLLGERHTYGPLELAVGDRVICRRNDRLIDVDNGMRGTVRCLDSDRVVIDTDSMLVRELPAAYAAKYLEHAYALTGHGMQGATVESAIVIASAHELTAGWSYTALSRARTHTRLLIHDQQLTHGRGEFAPGERVPIAARTDLLARVQRRMLERDDEDLAIEQLPAVGRAQDPEVAAPRKRPLDPEQERAAVHAERTPPAPPTPARVTELRERLEQLHAHLHALRLREVQRIEDLDARALALASRRDRITRQLAALPEPRRRRGRHQDPHALERARLSTARQASDRQHDELQRHRRALERGLGDPAQTRAERDALEDTINQLTHEHTAARDQHAELELHTPSPWIEAQLGKRPQSACAREQWEAAVRQPARYCAEHAITDPRDALGQRPAPDKHPQQWEHAHRAIEQTQQPLGCSLQNKRTANLEIEL